MTNIEVSVFKHFQNTQDPHNVSIDKILTFIRDGRWREPIEFLRSKDTKDKKDELKKNLPMVLFAGKFTERKDTAITEYSGFMIVDFDNVDRPDITKQQIIKSKYVYSAFISPSGNGVKALVRISANDETTFKNTFNVLYDYFDRKIDKSGKNVSRGCFVSYDSNLYINENAEIFPVKLPKKEVIVIKDNTLFNEIYQFIKKLKDAPKNFVKNNRNNFIFELACSCAEYGIPQDVLQGYCIKDFENVDFSSKEITTTINSAYLKIGTQKFGSKKYWQKEIYEIAKGIILDERRRDIENLAKELADAHNLSYGDMVLMVDYIMKQDLNFFETFWEIKRSKSTIKKFEIDRYKFLLWLEKEGFSRHELSSKEHIFVHLDNNILDEFKSDNFPNYVRQYLESLPEKVDGGKRFDLINTLVRAVQTLFNDKNLKIINAHTLTQHKSTEFEAYLYFRNKVVKITKDNIETLDYLYIDGYIWKNQIIDFDIELSDDYEGDWFKFIQRVCNMQPDKIRYCMSLIGYLLHDFKISDENYAVVFVDENISDTAEGGTGKSLLVESLAKIKNVVKINSKDDNDNKSFRFERVKPDTQIVALEDIKKTFNFKSFYNFVTGGIEIEEKFKPKYYIEFDKSPKIVITSNYALSTGESSTARRVKELDFSNYYNVNHKPKEDFGRRFFDEWDNAEWNRFYNFYIKCLQLFLQKGIITDGVVSENNQLKKFSQFTCKEFVEFFNDNIEELKKPMSVKSLREKFINTYDMPEITSQRFRKWLTLVKSYTQFNKADSFKYTDGHQYFCVTGKPVKVPRTTAKADVNELF